MHKVEAIVSAHPETGARALLLFAALISFVVSVLLWFTGHKLDGIFVGIWFPRFCRSRQCSREGARDDGATAFLIGVFVTLLVSVDEPFARLPEGTFVSLLEQPEKLREIVAYHIMPGRITASDVARLTNAPTPRGHRRVGPQRHPVDAAHVLDGDVEASNGLIHVIDSVLLPGAI
jgi:hypothetical protein